jgi:hypothetical protein
MFSPYTGNSALIAVESGNEAAGRWINERRDVFRDFQACFGEDPPAIGAIAIMTDTDNTGESTTAYKRSAPLTLIIFEHAEITMTIRPA